MSTSKFPLGLLVAVVMFAGGVGLFLSHTSAQQTRVIHLVQGWNSVAWTGEKQSASEALADLGDAVSAVYGYDNDSHSFTRYMAGRPEVSTLTDFEPEQAYWVLAQRSADWSVPGPAAPSCPTVAPCLTPTPCPTGTPCPYCPPAPDPQSADCAGVKVGIELDELLLEIAKAGKLVGPGGQVDASEVEGRLADSNQFFDTYCQGVDLSPSLNTLLTSSCATAGKWKGSLSSDMFYAPSTQTSIWLSMATRIVDQYCFVVRP